MYLLGQLYFDRFIDFNVFNSPMKVNIFITAFVFRIRVLEYLVAIISKAILFWLDNSAK